MTQRRTSTPAEPKPEASLKAKSKALAARLVEAARINDPKAEARVEQREREQAAQFAAFHKTKRK